MAKKIKVADPASKLEKRVQAIINRMGGEYDEGVVRAMEDVRYGGCSSGIVPDLIYNTDTVKFYRAYRNEINALLAEDCREMGQAPQDMLAGGWDNDDPLALEQSNQNLLAWYGFETVVNIFMSRIDNGESDE